MDHVLLVRKLKGPASLRGKWNGIGGKIEPGESPSLCARREFFEETGIAVHKDDMVCIEAQYFQPGGSYDGDRVWWYATKVESLWRRIPTNGMNDVGEPLHLWSVEKTQRMLAGKLCPNVEYLIPKALVYLRTPHLDRPWW